MRKKSHSDFYYRLNDMCSKVFMYNETYNSKAPFYERAFKEKKRVEEQNQYDQYRRQMTKDQRRSAIRVKQNLNKSNSKRNIMNSSPSALKPTI